MRKVATFLALVVVVSCGAGPEGGLRLSEGAATENAGAPAAEAKPEARGEAPGGFLAALFGASAAPEARDDPDQAAMTIELAETTEVTTAPADTETGEAEQAAASAPPRSRGQGLFAALFGGDRQAGTDAQAQTVKASLPAPGDVAGDDDTAVGTRLPYGEVAKVCGVPERKLGRKIAQYPERRPLHRLYDSDPGNTGPHSFYLTGFSDGCARQFTAALAVFGSVAMHEQLRYGLPAEVQPYSDTDKSYERIKRRVCGKPRRKPCGSKIGLLENNTVFLSIYERFEGNAQWTNLLLHRGAIVAQDRKKGG